MVWSIKEIISVFFGELLTWIMYYIKLCHIWGSEDVAGGAVALPQQCQPHQSCLFFWEAHHCRATPHSYGVWTPLESAEPELINSVFPGLQRQSEAPVPVLNSYFTLVLKYLSSSVLPLHGHNHGGMDMDMDQVCTPRAGEGTGPGGSVIWGSEHFWTMRASAV